MAYLDAKTKEQYEDFLALADKIAEKAHQGQLDKAGRPYIEHPRQVCRLVKAAPLSEFISDPELFRYQACVAALLHDVIEDSELSLQNLTDYGFPPAVIEAVDLLTHRPEDSYQEYLARLKPNLLARTVKMQDLAHNSDPSRIRLLTEKDRLRLAKYEAAKAFLAAE